MKIEFLNIRHFRNIESATLTDLLRLNVIIGKNGSGKTSILEAIYFLGLARSFRTVHSQKLIQHHQENFLLFTRVHKEDRTIQIGIEKTQSNITIRINGENIKNSSQLAKNLPVQIINTNVHELIEEGPLYRRKFIEWGVFHVEHRYADLCLRLRHLLKQRNYGLKKHLPRSELKHWDKELASVATEINEHRETYFVSLMRWVNTLLAKQHWISDISIEYRQGWSAEKEYCSVLEECWQGDLESGYTRFGPHKAELSIKQGKYPAKEVLSRGQLKLLACLLRLAQINCLSEASGDQVILMIDDLAAELDSSLREFLLKESIASGAQIFVTATDENALLLAEIDGPYRMFHVEHGKVKSVL